MTILWHLVVEFQRRHDSPWGWVCVFFDDWVLSALCILLPRVTMRMRRNRAKTTEIITWAFCWCLCIHFLLLPVAAFTRIWQVRLATDTTLLMVFIVCYNRALSLRRERERALG